MAFLLRHEGFSHSLVAQAASYALEKLNLELYIRFVELHVLHENPDSMVFLHQNKIHLVLEQYV